MRVSQETLSRYGGSLRAIADEAAAALRADLESYVAELGGIESMGRDDIEGLRDYAASSMRELWAAYGQASASVGSVFFDETTGGAVQRDAGFEVDASYERALASARYWVGQLFEEGADLGKFVDGCSSFLHRNVTHAADEAATARAAKDVKLRYARVPQGPSCGFCIMLASRGFVYASRESAGDEGGPFNEFHDWCDCHVVVGYDGLEVEGYDPDGMYERYLQCRRAVGDTESLWEAWQALSAEERDSYGRGVRAIPLSEDPVEDARLRKKLGAQADGFNDYVSHRVAQEMDTRDREWLYSKALPPVADVERGAKPKLHERKTAEKLRPCGYRLMFRKPTGDGRTSDIYIITGTKESPVYEKWEMKRSQGDQQTRIIGKSNIRNQFKSARGQSRKLIIDVESVIGFTDTDGVIVSRQYLIEAANDAILHHEVAPFFDEVMLVFGEGDILKIQKKEKAPGDAC